MTSTLVKPLVAALVLLAVSRGSTVTDDQLREVTNSMWILDENEVGSLLELDLQGDKFANCSENFTPLFTKHPPFIKGTWPYFMNLLDNYEPDVQISENPWSGAEQELKEFVEQLWITKPIILAKDFLIQNEFVQNQDEFQEKFKTIWFERYKRCSRDCALRSSSGFEHVFLGEIKSQNPIGFHGWAYFSEKEKDRQIDYQGVKHFKRLSKDYVFVQVSFKFRDYCKDITSLLIGSSVELEMAILTVCWFARPNGGCPAQMGRFNVTVMTFVQDMKYVGSGYISDVVGTDWIAPPNTESNQPNGQRRQRDQFDRTQLLDLPLKRFLVNSGNHLATVDREKDQTRKDNVSNLPF
ncbi:unnamed protein product [Cyprideis torosa]|uniref:EndoU domain-containing protein n=1 Tax=Cyprideis torosa TaxID=163714 RepID=A0A7R8WF40_9CRUS|nr:unnamed protein product [Cyprideis torosa]CAG0893665.1 unnamed protein product [Cyprideis torosa]